MTNEEIKKRQMELLYLVSELDTKTKETSINELAYNRKLNSI